MEPIYLLGDAENFDLLDDEGATRHTGAGDMILSYIRGPSIFRLAKSNERNLLDSLSEDFYAEYQRIANAISETNYVIRDGHSDNVFLDCNSDIVLVDPGVVAPVDKVLGERSGVGTTAFSNANAEEIGKVLLSLQDLFYWVTQESTEQCKGFVTRMLHDGAAFPIIGFSHRGME
jgi:hypothetical protein